MRSPAIPPATAFVAGVGCGVSLSLRVPHVATLWLAVALLACVAAAHGTGASARRALIACAFGAAGLMHGADARDAALNSRLRAALDAAYGRFLIGAPGVAGPHEGTRLRARLTDDAADREGFVSLRARAVAVWVGGRWHPADGDVVLTVSGVAARQCVAGWRAGREIEAPVTLRRPARYLDAGVPDFERDAALGGITLFGSIKSCLVVEVTRRGSRVAEAAADARAFVRRAVQRWVAPHGNLPAAIVTAVLIGDRTGLPDEVRTRLQAAGTYHVIAISGGNIAILAAVIVGMFAAAGLHGRLVAAAAMAMLLAYAQVAAAGPSVWRATLMAVLYFAARLFDHRTPAWHATAVAAAVMAAVQPLDVRDPGFLLTFGATLALLEAGTRVTAWMPRHRFAAWTVASVSASLAAEVGLLPISAFAFSRVTGAGPLLNLVAIPVMGVAQIAGLVVVACDRIDVVARPAGWLAAAATSLLVDSARLVDAIPWIVRRVPPPPLWLIAAYYVALIVALRATRPRLQRVALVSVAGAAFLVVGGVHLPRSGAPTPDTLRLTVFDVGQGESMLLETPGGHALLVDSGGAPFGGGAFDVGGRVLAPALWARGVRTLDTLLVTHGDPDHIGGAPAVLHDFAPHTLWWGIPVPPHQPTRELLAAAAERGVRLEWRRAGEALPAGESAGPRKGPASLLIRVLNPPEPDWERQQVRNDDSVVLEVLYGDVALLLTGDISAEVERQILPHLTPARTRILKAAHHGSRTSSSRALVESWRPQIALISCGRGNTFGHPAPEVIARLESVGARVYRTDLDGEVTLTTDGARLSVTTFTGERR